MDALAENDPLGKVIATPPASSTKREIAEDLYQLGMSHEAGDCLLVVQTKVVNGRVLLNWVLRGEVSQGVADTCAVIVATHQQKLEDEATADEMLKDLMGGAGV
jgi:hypothetical protein